MSVDGTDYRVAVSYQKSYWSYKFKKSGLRYEIAICIKTGKMVWWNGPYLPGDFNDNMIFQDALVAELEPGERAETDRGYRHSAPAYTRVPDGTEDPARSEMTARVRLRHETCNNRLKKWNILAVSYRHDVQRHQNYFGAVAALVQLSFVDEPLFPVEYND